MRILDGKQLAGEFQNKIRAEVDLLSPKVGRAPGLGVILVGDNPGSKSYVARKEKVAEQECGFVTKDHKFSENCSKEELEAAIADFNADSEVDGILLQLPLPEHLDDFEFIDKILPEKDVDGLHPHNQGLLQRNEATFVPCTPQGCMHLLDLVFTDGDLSGKTAVIVGRSILVGKPLHALLLNKNATVIHCHSRTQNIAALCSQADILIAAAGAPGLIKADWVKEDAVVIDVGVSKNEAGKIVGDVDFDQVAPKISAITKVPGGVGPMTVAMLMQNTLTAYKLHKGIS